MQPHHVVPRIRQRRRASSHHNQSSALSSDRSFDDFSKLRCTSCVRTYDLARCQQRWWMPFFYLIEFSRLGEDQYCSSLIPLSRLFTHLMYGAVRKGGKSPPLAASQQKRSRVMAVISAATASTSVICRYHSCYHHR